MNCPHCHQPIDDQLVKRHGARIIASMRTERKGGRPRKQGNSAVKPVTIAPKVTPKVDADFDFGS